MPHKGIDYQNLMAFCIHMFWQYSVTVALMFIKTELCKIVTVRRQFEMK